MTGWSAAGLVLWLLLSAASMTVWVPWWQPGKALLGQAPVLLLTLGVVLLGTGGVALLGAVGDPLSPPWSWLAVGLGGLAALLTGGAVVFCLLALVDATAPNVASARVQRVVLQGGAWVGSLERLALFGTVLAGWPEGVVAIVAVKAFARYPELRLGPVSGAVERFIIGTFASLIWAALCVGVTTIYL